jgi:RHS repeat-associated protein
MLRDDDVKEKVSTTTKTEGTGNSYDFGARIYDPRVGRFLSLDPMMNRFPWQSPYLFAGNDPIGFIDFEGKGKGKRKTLNNNGFAVSAQDNVETFQRNEDKIAIDPWERSDAVAQNILRFTDIDDFVVIVTALIPGVGAHHVNGEPANGDDVQAAEFGLLIPYASGSATKQTLKTADEVIDKSKDAVKVTKKIAPNPFGSPGKPDHKAKV